ncbi:DUF4185 domain-containing protein [Nonomuraea sp. NPDC046570]|uniref:DUF4185 domain-containing protein n=1 Tax=Nonomuraea sp. NPDC046570 TaxID=3155255 RepID=UPI0033F80FE6
MPRLLFLAMILLGVAVVPHQASALSCERPAFQGSSTNTRLTSLFTHYGNDNDRLDDWTGADGTYSLRLPGGKELWVFSDTFLGQVNPDGSRPPTHEEGGTTAFLNNSFAVERHGRLVTIHDGTAEAPKAVMPPRDGKHWYWAGDATLAGGVVEVTYQEYERFGAGAWDWRRHRNVVARFSPGRLRRPLSVHPLPSVRGVAWAAGLHRDGRHTYVYGVEDHGSTKYMHVARVEGRSLLGRWEYLTAAGAWSAHEADSGRVMDGVANEYSVSRVGDAYLLITHDTTEALSARIVAYTSCTPYGPFTGKTVVHTTPETGGNIFTYNAHAHPEIREGGKLVISYNVNSFVDTDHYRDVTIYRPRFVNLSFRS